MKLIYFILRVFLGRRLEKKTREFEFHESFKFFNIFFFLHFLHFEQVRLAYLIQMAIVLFDSLQHCQVQKFYFVEFLVHDQQQLLDCLRLKDQLIFVELG